ncbi:MAG TPA: acyltransferase family protein [Actinocrinis sp.]|nr:acyltransferase family protein [Actinocrinis sp.]
MPVPLQIPAVRGPGPGDRPGHRSAGLDGLRALAVAAVVLYHLNAAWLPGGFLGVDVFFVLSGYLITSLLLAEHRRAGRLNPRAFWARRARRLLPELFAVLAVTCAAAMLIGRGCRIGLRGSVLAALGFYGNWWQIHLQSDYFARFGPLPLFQHLWSLAVEEQFYLVWPLLLSGLLAAASVRRAAQLTTLLAATSFALMALGSLAGTSPDRLYYGTDSHSGGLLLGAALALQLPLAQVPTSTRLSRRGTLTASVALTVLAASAVLLSGDAPLTYEGGIAAASLATAVLCLAATRPGPISRALSCGPLPWLGRRSYSIYLWHWPMIACLSYRPLPAALTDWEPVLEVAGTLLLAAVSYRYLQQPVTADGWRGAFNHLITWYDTTMTAHPRTARVYLAASGSVVVLATLAVSAAPPEPGLQAQISAGQQAIATDGSAAPGTEPAPAAPALPATSAAAPATPPTPAPAGPDGSDITAIGDSVMVASAPALEKTLPGINIYAQVGRQMTEAPAILRNLLDQGQLRQTVVVGLGTNGSFSLDVLTTIAAILGPDRTLVLLTVHVPDPWQDPVNAAVTAFARIRPHTVLVDWNSVCDADPGMLWQDHTHPRPSGATVYADTLKAAL